MAFLTEPEPARGVAETIAPGILRLVARNPGSMTCHGTNTWLIETPDGLAILDPGPASDEQHVEEILAAVAGAPLAGILISHGHHDHIGAVEALKQRKGAPTFGYPKSVSPDFNPDVAVGHGDTVFGMEAIYTPGHAPDHLCFARPDGLVFTGDHVMGWSSSVVSPPNGNMRDYMTSLQLLIDRGDRTYLPGHGPALTDPIPYVAELLRRRVLREAEILDLLQGQSLSVPDIGRRLYAKIDPVLQGAAERNVLSHLQKLWDEGKVVEDDKGWQAV